MSGIGTAGIALTLGSTVAGLVTGKLMADSAGATVPFVGGMALGGVGAWLTPSLSTRRIGGAMLGFGLGAALGTSLSGAAKLRGLTPGQREKIDVPGIGAGAGFGAALGAGLLGTIGAIVTRRPLQSAMLAGVGGLLGGAIGHGYSSSPRPRATTPASTATSDASTLDVTSDRVRRPGTADATITLDARPWNLMGTMSRSTSVDEPPLP